MWKVLLSLTRFALDSNSLVCGAAPVINNGAAAVGHRLFYFGLFFIAFVFFRVAKSLMKGDITSAVRTGGTFVLLFALVVTVTSSSERAATLPKSEQASARGTLPGFTTFVTGATGKLTGQLFTATSLLRVPGTVEGAKKGTSVSAEGNSPTCEAYTNKLRQNYLATSNSPTLVAVSGLWEKTFYKSWQTAMFGSPVNGVDIPGRVMCHWADASSGISPSEIQNFAATVPGYQGIKTTASGRVLAFGPYSVEDRRRAMTAWAVCETNAKGSWQTRAEWKGVWGSDDAFGTSRCGWLLSPGGKFGDKAVTAGGVLGSVCGIAGSVAGQVCQAAGDKITIVGGDDPFNLFGTSFGSAFESDTLTPEMRDQLASAKSYANAFNGYNGADRLVEGFMALIVAFFFLLALGSLAIGAFVSQLLLIVLLIFSPITITLFALGSKRGSAMAKLTGTTMVSQAFFTLLITVVVAIADVFQSMVEGIVSFGLMRSIMVGLAPLAAFYAVRKMLMAFGMADILKPTGSMSFMASAAMVATGDKRLVAAGKVDDSGRNAIQRSGSKIAAKGINAGFAAAAAAGTLGSNANRWSKTGEERADLDEAHKAKKDAMKRARLNGRLNRVAEGVEGRLERGETDRVNRGLNFLADAAGSHEGTGRLGRALLLASEMSDKAINMASDDVSEALGVGQASTSFNAEDLELSDPTFMDASRIAQMNRITEARLERDLAAAGGDPVKIAAAQDAFNSSIIVGAGRQYLGETYDGHMLAPQEAASYAMALDATRGGSHLVTSTGMVVPRNLAMTRDEMRNDHSGTTDEMFRLPEVWLDKTVVARRSGETDDQWAGRIHLVLQSEGLMDASGRRVDMLEKMNLTLDDVADWRAGVKNDVLDKKSVHVHKSSAALRRSHAFNDHLRRRERMFSDSLRSIETHMIAEVAAIRDELPALSIDTAETWKHLEASLSPLADVSARIDDARLRGESTADLEAVRRTARSAFEAANKEWVSSQVKLAGSVIASQQMLSSRTGEVKTGDEFRTGVVEATERLEDALKPLLQLAERAFVGQRDAMDELKKLGKSITEDTQAASQAANKAIEAAGSALKVSAEQAAATSRIKRAPQYTTTRDLVGQAMASIESELPILGGF